MLQSLRKQAISTDLITSINIALHGLRIEEGREQKRGAKETILFAFSRWDNLFHTTNYLNKILLEIETSVFFLLQFKMKTTTTTTTMKKKENKCDICDIMRATRILMHRLEKDLNLCWNVLGREAIYFNDGNERERRCFTVAQLDNFTYRDVKRQTRLMISVDHWLLEDHKKTLISYIRSAFAPRSLASLANKHHGMVYNLN